jgi:SPP1 family predicted phage head-tail adaptor
MTVQVATSSRILVKDIPMKTKSLSIGARARRFVLELPLEQPDGFGGVIRTYAPGPQLWGAIEMLSGTERVRADRPEQSLTHRITLRYREGVTGAMRLTSGLRRFAIRAAADPDGSKRDLVCLVEEMRA